MSKYIVILIVLIIIGYLSNLFVVNGKLFESKFSITNAGSCVSYIESCTHSVFPYIVHRKLSATSGSMIHEESTDVFSVFGFCKIVIH